MMGSSASGASAAESSKQKSQTFAKQSVASSGNTFTTSSGAKVSAPPARPDLNYQGKSILGKIGQDIAMGVDDLMGQRSDKYSQAEWQAYDTRTAQTQARAAADQGGDRDEPQAMTQTAAQTGGGGQTGGGQAASTGPFDRAEVETYLKSRLEGVKKSGLDRKGIEMFDVSPDQFIAEAESGGEFALSRYMTKEEIAGLSQRQKLAAAERFRSKSGRNFLSDADLEFVRAGGGEGVVYSPMRSIRGEPSEAGDKESLSFLSRSTPGGILRAVETGRVSKEDLTPEQMKVYKFAVDRRKEARKREAALSQEYTAAGGRAAREIAMREARTPEEKRVAEAMTRGVRSTILTRPGGLLGAGATTGSRGLVG